MTVDWLTRETGSPPLVIAHRGSSGKAPENTIAAFELAVSQGARAVECDVVLSSDGVPVVIHDTTLDRTTTGTGNVVDHAWTDLASLDAGAWKGRAYAGERLPRLGDLLSVAVGRARIVIELKDGDPQGLAIATREAIASNPGVEVAVISFIPDVVRAVRRVIPNVAVGFLYWERQDFARDDSAVIEKAREMDAHFIGPQTTLVTADLCRAAHVAGFAVSTWTANDPDVMRRLARDGVDAITTDWPDRAFATFGSALPR
jgi:glycerophosphoryl diester phosphodiesterase